MEPPSTPLAPEQVDTAQSCTPCDADEASSKKQASRAALKAQKRLMADFAAAVGSLALEEEARISAGGAGRDAAKQRRRALREVSKVVADSSRPLEERMQVLLEHHTAAVEAQQTHNKQVAQLQAQLAAARQEADTGRAALARAQDQVEKLGALARSLSTENKALQARVAAADNMRSVVEDIQEKITAQQLETEKVVLSRQALEQENVLLKGQLQSTGSVLDELRQQQEARLNALADKLKEQDVAMQQTQQAHAAMSSLIAENKVLTLRAAAADEMKVRMELMEKLLAESQSQCEQYRGQMQDVQSTLKAASALTQTVDKMQRHAKEQQKAMTKLLGERQVLTQQVQMLTQQAREQGDKLRRSQAQKLRLEGLCRALQQGRGGSEGGADAGGGDADEAPAMPGDAAGVADAGEAAARRSQDGAASAGGGQHQQPAAASAGDGTGESSDSAAA